MGNEASFRFGSMADARDCGLFRAACGRTGGAHAAGWVRCTGRCGLAVDLGVDAIGCILLGDTAGIPAGTFPAVGQT
jgi:hypothetical protein